LVVYSREPHASRYTREQLEFCSKKSWENMIDYYADRLLRVLNGEKITEIFTHSERMSLRRRGILVKRRRGERVAPRNLLSPRVVSILESIMG